MEEGRDYSCEQTALWSSCQLRHLWKKDRSVWALVELDANWKLPIQIMGAIVSATKEGFGVLKRSNTKQRNIGVHLRRIGRHFTNKSSYFTYKTQQTYKEIKDVDQQQHHRQEETMSIVVAWN